MESSARDLVAVADEQRWHAIETRADAEVLADLVLRTRSRGNRLVDDVVDRILETIPSYSSGVVTREDLWWSVQRNLELNLLTVAEQRDVTFEELAVRSQLGVRRAMAGIPIPDLLRAFRTGYLMLWEALIDEARTAGTPAIEALLDSTARVWNLLDRVSAGVEDAYRAYQSVSDTRSRRQSQAFLAGICALPANEEATAQIARSLGFDPAGAFLCAVVDAHLPAHSVALDGVVVEQPDRTVVVIQPAQTAAEAESGLAERLTVQGMTAIGVGTMGSGLPGALSSLRGAERAHRVAHQPDRAAVLFRRDWFACLTCESADLLAPLVSRLVGQLESSQEVTTTLAAVVASGGNLTAAARALHVHPNTVAYRVERVRKLTGVDLRSPQGLLDAHLACVLAGQRTHPGAVAAPA